MPKDSIFNAYSASYNAIHTKHLPPGISHEQFFVQKLAWVREWIDRKGNQSPAVLDFGCNQGELTEAIQTLYPGSQVIGVDEAEESLNVARKKALPKGTALNYHLSLESMDSSLKFDIITCFNVLHHVPISERKNVLRSLQDRLGPGGVLLIWEHNLWNPLTRYLVKICPFDEGVTLVPASWLRGSSVAMGSEIQELEYLNIAPPRLHRFWPIKAMERLLRDLPIGAQFRAVLRIKG